MQIIYFLPEQHQWRSSINFAMHKIKLNQVHSQQVQLKIILKEELKVLIQVTMRFHLWAQSKKHQHTETVFTWCISYDGAIRRRGSPYLHSFVWIFTAPNIENENAYIEFIEKMINAQLSDYLIDPELFELISPFQVFKPFLVKPCHSPIVNILLRRQLLQKHLILDLALMKNKRFK